MNKKEILIDTARDLFTTYGYNRVSMDEIAKNANITKKTIYSYFKDKETLFQYFIDEELNKMKQEIEKKEKKNLPFLEKVTKVLFYMLDFRRNSKLLNALTGEKDICYSKKLLEKYDNEIIVYIQSKIEKEIEFKNIKNCNAKLMAFIIYKIYIAILFEYDDELNEKQVVKEVTLILKEGLFN